MKFSLALVFITSLFISIVPTHADVSKTLASYDYLSDPDIEALIDTAAPMLRNYSCLSQFRSYLKKTKTKFKAFAFTALDDGSKQFCRTTKQKTQALANSKAVKLCDKRKKRKLPKCKLFASGDEIKLSITYVENEVKSRSDDLFYAIHKLSLSSIKKLVEAGADIHIKSKDKHKNTPLLLAMRLNRLDVIEYLLSKGANINDRNNAGIDALNLAAQKDSFAQFEYILSRGGNINTTTTHTKRQPIHYAAQTKYGELKILELILNKEGDINAQDHTKRTPLHHASKKRRYTPLKYLVENGADINAKNASGQTPLDVAGNNKIRKYLIKQGAKSGVE